jgi:hypothetical protein
MSRRRTARNLASQSNREYELYLRDKGERQEEEYLRQQFIGEFGRLPRNATERANFIRQIQQAEAEQRRRNNEEWAVIQAEHMRKNSEYRAAHPEEFKTPEPEQAWKLQMLHRKNPNVGDTSLAEELSMFHGNTRRLKRYVRPRVKHGMPLNKALNEFAQGGPFVEGTGKGPKIIVPKIGKNLLTVNNAKKLNLFKNYYGEFFDPTLGAYRGYSQRNRGNGNGNRNSNGRNGAAVGGPRRRKTRKANSR